MKATFTFSDGAMKIVRDLARQLGVPPTVVVERALGLLRTAVKVQKDGGMIIAKTKKSPVELRL